MKLEALRTELEAKRKRITVSTMIGYALVGIGLLLALFSVLGRRNLIFPVSLIMILVGIGFTFYSSNERKNYVNYIKQELAENIFKSSFEDAQFQPTEGFSRQYLRNLELENMGDSSKSEDLLTGSYKGVKFQMSDVLIEETTPDGEGNSSTTTLFKGQWLIFTFNKNFTSYMQIRPKGFIFKNKKPYKWFTERPELELLKFENGVFNETFEVYASDAHEAYYLITPHFMEKILTLNRESDSKIKFGFIDNQFHVTINSDKDLFELNIWEPISESYIEQVQKEIEIIKFIIDTLGLQNKITN